MRSVRAARAQRGITLVELALVLVIISILAGGAALSLGGWATNLRARHAARDMADILNLGRAESIRTGTPHVAFFAMDTAGNPLLGEDGATRVWAVLVADNDGDLLIDPGELRATVPSPPAGTNLQYGRAVGRPLVPRNVGARMGDPFWNTGVEGTAEETNSPANFRHPNDPNDVQNWVLFAPDGTPRSARPDGVGGTVTGAIGSGDGAIYVTNGEREYSVVMAPLGGVRVFQWDIAGAQWR
jgi:prepilin-type N-terminal cleavage/methylation domain-containing protein